MSILAIITKAEQALNLLKLVEPMVGIDGDVVKTATDVVGRALSGAKFGLEGYTELVNELNGVIVELEAIRGRGGVTGDDFRTEVARIEARGSALDQLKERLQGN